MQCNAMQRILKKLRMCWMKKEAEDAEDAEAVQNA